MNMVSKDNGQSDAATSAREDQVFLEQTKGNVRWRRKGLIVLCWVSGKGGFQ